MFLTYHLLLFICFFITILNKFDVENFIGNYFAFSIVNTIASFLLSHKEDQLIRSNLYISLVVIWTIVGVFFRKKKYIYLTLISNSLLIYILIKFKINIQFNIIIFFNISIFILIAIYNKFYAKFYYYLFSILLSATFINDFWLTLLSNNKEAIDGLSNSNMYFTFSFYYLITFYLIFIVYHVKFRINK